MVDTAKSIVGNELTAILEELCRQKGISPVLAKIYNKCLAESCFPSRWKSSSVVPVFKNDGDRSDPGKYCLLPIINKIFGSFINYSLTKHLDITGLFLNLHYGFRSFRSTADILAVRSERIYNSLEAGGETRAI